MGKVSDMIKKRNASVDSSSAKDDRAAGNSSKGEPVVADDDGEAAQAVSNSDVDDLEDDNFDDLDASASNKKYRIRFSDEIMDYINSTIEDKIKEKMAKFEEEKAKKEKELAGRIEKLEKETAELTSKVAEQSNRFEERISTLEKLVVALKKGGGKTSSGASSGKGSGGAFANVTEFIYIDPDTEFDPSDSIENVRRLAKRIIIRG